MANTVCAVFKVYCTYMEWQNKELMAGEITAWAIIHIFDFF